MHREHEMLMAKVQFGGIGRRLPRVRARGADRRLRARPRRLLPWRGVGEEEAKRIYEMLELMGGLEELNEPPESQPARSQTLWRKVEPSAIS